SSDLAFLQAAYQQLFHRPADQAAFNTWLPGLPSAALAVLQGPVGSISPLSITNVDPTTNETVQLTFASQALEGTYSLFVGVTNQGVAIKDLTDLNGTFINTGNVMNQNGNAVNGEFPSDRFVGSFALTTSDDANFISGLYHDLLGAEPGGRPVDNSSFAL